jgi:glycolate oxidase FAD binding subunit
MSDLEELQPATQDELAALLTANARGPRRAIYPAGGRTAWTFGYAFDQPGAVLSTTALNRVVDYPARDMTITVEAGIRLDELASALRGERQRLAVDVAQSHRATLGGAIATNTSGPRRYGLGTLRDYVIGISAVTADGTAFKAGGRVVKNVAGYDLCKMLIGSLGTLAVVTQVTLKLKPEPDATALVWLPFDKLNTIDDVLQRLTTSAARPVALEVFDQRGAAAIASESGLDLPHETPVLCAGVEGTPRETQWQLDALRAEVFAFNPREMINVTGGDATRLWFALTEFQTAAEEPLTFQANLLPSRTVEFVDRASHAGVTVQAHAGNGIVLGELPDGVTTAAAAAEIIGPLRQLARSCRGNLIVLNCDATWKRDLRVWGDPEPSWPLMKRLKDQLDPLGRLNPGRFLDILS